MLREFESNWREIAGTYRCLAKAGALFVAIGVFLTLTGCQSLWSPEPAGGDFMAQDRLTNGGSSGSSFEDKSSQSSASIDSEEQISGSGEGVSVKAVFGAPQ